MKWIVTFLSIKIDDERSRKCLKAKLDVYMAWKSLQEDVHD